MNRCRLLANVIRKTNQGTPSPSADRIDLIAAEFAAQGIDFERPYLNAGSVDQFDLECAASGATT
jgi:hypothetical protein